MDELERYRALGLSVIPLHPGAKTPAVPSWIAYQSRHATDAECALWWPDAEPLAHNIGIVCGEVSGNLAVVDCDDLDTAATMRALLPDTMRVRTSHGVHLYYRMTEATATTAFTLNGRTHHVKAHGGYVVAPPSLHPDGIAYRHDNGLDPVNLEPAALRAALLGAGARPGLTTDAQGRQEAGWVAGLLSRRINEGERHESYARLAGYLSNRLHMDETCAVLRLWMESCVDGYENMAEYHNPEAQVRQWYIAEGERR